MTRDRGGGGRIRRQLVVHRGRIGSDEQVEVDGLRVTSAARTVVELARTLPFEQSLVIGDAALRMGKTWTTPPDGSTASARRPQSPATPPRLGTWLPTPRI